MNRLPPSPGRRISACLFASLLLSLMSATPALLAQGQADAKQALDRAELTLAALPSRDLVLGHYEAGAWALRAGRWADARRHFDAALLPLAQAATRSKNARDARKLYRREAASLFLGQPYERAMASFYRGLIYWHDGDLDQARNCFRALHRIDGDPIHGAYRGDWVLAHWLEGLLSERLGAGAGPALSRAEQLLATPLPANSPEATLIVVEFGAGPQKFPTPSTPPRLRFESPPPAATHAMLRIGKNVHRFLAMDDLQFQASTVDGQPVDWISARSEPGKEELRALDKALTENLAAASATPGDPELAELIERLEACTPQESVELRAWDSLPRFLSARPVELPPGQHEASLELFDGRRFVSSQTVTLEIPAEGPRICLLSAVIP